MAKPSPGQSLVEVALVLPVLLILFLGVAEIGYWLFAHVEVANATRSGAREGSLCRVLGTCVNLSAEVEAAVFEEAQYVTIDSSNTSVNTQPSSSTLPPTGSPITVTVTYSHTPLILSDFVPMFPSPLPVQRTVIMSFSN